MTGAVRERFFVAPAREAFHLDDSRLSGAFEMKVHLAVSGRKLGTDDANILQGLFEPRVQVKMPCSLGMAQVRAPAGKYPTKYTYRGVFPCRDCTFPSAILRTSRQGRAVPAWPRACFARRRVRPPARFPFYCPKMFSSQSTGPYE